MAWLHSEFYNSSTISIPVMSNVEAYEGDWWQSYCIAPISPVTRSSTLLHKLF